MNSTARGAALIDLVCACGVAATLAAIVVPSIHAARDRDSARLAARFVADQLHLVRLEALKRNATMSIRFDPQDIGRFVTYADGDADGVLQSDIDRGVDYPIAVAARITDFFESATFRIMGDLPDPDGTGTLLAGSDPLRLGGSNFLSFSPLGSATSGTIYVAGRTGTQMAVRVYGATGRLRVLAFDRASGLWRAD